MIRALATLMVLTLAGCAERAPAGVVPLEAVATIRATFDGGPAMCSGVLIAPRTVLTAAHCRPLAMAEGAVVELGMERHGVAATERHLRQDLAVLTLDRASVVQPLPVAAHAPLVGDLVEVASARGGGWRAPHRVTSIDATSVLAEGAPNDGVCAGDSGGPLVVEAAGTLAVVAILSRGSFDCRGHGRFSRLDVAGDWLATRAR